MISVAALTSGRFVPSSQFRVRQHLAPLRDLGVAVREYLPVLSKFAPLPGLSPYKGRPPYGNPLAYLWEALKLLTRLPGVLGSHRHQITWLERGLMEYAPSLEPLLKRPLVVDVDDAIFLTPPLGRYCAILAAKLAAIVIVGNQYLADWYSQYARDIRIVPTAVDTHRFHPRDLDSHGHNGKFTIGWTGSAINLPYLEALESPLRHFLEKYPDTEILVTANAPPSFSKISRERVRFLPWSPDVEAEAVRQMHVGLMPLPDDPWTRGKCSFKMLQYMATGIPVVVSPVGMNADLLAQASPGLAARNDDDWYEALTYFYLHRHQGQEYGLRGRQLVEQEYSREVISAKLAAIFKEIANAGHKAPGV